MVHLCCVIYTIGFDISVISSSGCVNTSHPSIHMNYHNGHIYHFLFSCCHMCEEDMFVQELEIKMVNIVIVTIHVTGRMVLTWLEDYIIGLLM